MSWIWAGLAAALALAPIGSALGQAGAPARKPAPAVKDPTTPLEALQQARAEFDYGDHGRVVRLLTPNAARIDNPSLRAEAFRLLGIALFYRDRHDEAAAVFIELLTLEPDEELDPFYISPRAITFFEDVKKNAEEMLRPLRENRKREAEERRHSAESEAQARKQREQEEEARRVALLRPPTILERRVVQREFWVSLLPFGIGQMQNGEQSLGTALATSQIVAGATSAGSALLIEALRDRSSGKFSAGSYNIASRLQYTKWIGAGLFYALWVGGAAHAAIRFKPEIIGRDLVLPSNAVPGGAEPQQPQPTPNRPPLAPTAPPPGPPLR